MNTARPRTCITARLHNAYYSQSPRLEKLGRNRYMATIFSLIPEKASEFILTKRQAKRAFPELMACLETSSKVNARTYMTDEEFLESLDA